MNDKVIPADIQADANTKYPIWVVRGAEIGDGTYDANHTARKAYYQGRLDERVKSNKNTIGLLQWLLKHEFQSSNVNKNEWWTLEFKRKTFPNPNKAFYTSEELLELYEKMK